MRIVGLAGQAGSGKTFLSREVLVGEGYLPLCLAGPMKARLTAEGVIPPNESTGRSDKSPRTRKILQIYGTELGRDRFHEDVWCSTLEWWIYWFMTHGHTRFSVGDVRYPNEVAWIHNLGGVVIRITGRGGLSGEAAEHISETSLDDLRLPELDNSPGRKMALVQEDLVKIIEDHYTEWPEPENEL